jgi:hypothetical protein
MEIHRVRKVVIKEIKGKANEKRREKKAEKISEAEKEEYSDSPPLIEMKPKEIVVSKPKVETIQGVQMEK